MRAAHHFPTSPCATQTGGVLRLHGRKAFRFTLIELLVVVAIIAILASMLLPALTGNLGFVGGFLVFLSFSRLLREFLDALLEAEISVHPIPIADFMSASPKRFRVMWSTAVGSTIAAVFSDLLKAAPGGLKVPSGA